MHWFESKPNYSLDRFSMEILVSVRFAYHNNLLIGTFSNIPNEYFTIYCSTRNNKRIRWMEFYACQAIRNFNGYVWLFRIEISSENAPKWDSTLMLTPWHMISFTKSSSKSSAIARPCNTYNLINIVTHFGRDLLFWISFTCLLFWLILLIFIKVVIEIIIILFICLLISFFIFFSLFHLLKCFLSCIIGINEIEICYKFVNHFSFFDCIILPNYIVFIKGMRFCILIKYLS